MNRKYSSLKKAYKIGSILFCGVALCGAFGENWIKSIHLPQLETTQNADSKKLKHTARKKKTRNKEKNNVVITISEEHKNNRKIYKKTIVKNGKVPAEYKHAIKLAEEYTDDGISKEDLYEQLYSRDGEDLSKPASQYAVDHVKVSWKTEAKNSGQDYVDDRLVKSKHELVEQLIDADQFTKSQAEYAATKVFEEE